MLTVCGRVQIRRVRWHSAAEGSEMPLDRVLDESERTISTGVREMLLERRSGLRTPQKRKALRELVQYVSERREMIRYPQFRQRGWQIGSGPTESVCKTTPVRVKGRGRRWDMGNAEAMMALAALHDSHKGNPYGFPLAPPAR